MTGDFSKLQIFYLHLALYFPSSSSESELEEVLTTYTKLNKSASIFLGSNSKSSYEPKANNTSTSGGSLVHSSSELQLSRRRESVESLHQDKGEFAFWCNDV